MFWSVSCTWCCSHNILIHRYDINVLACNSFYSQREFFFRCVLIGILFFEKVFRFAKNVSHVQRPESMKWRTHTNIYVEKCNHGKRRKPKWKINWYMQLNMGEAQLHISMFILAFDSSSYVLAHEPWPCQHWNWSYLIRKTLVLDEKTTNTARRKKHTKKNYVARRMYCMWIVCTQITATNNSSMKSTELWKNIWDNKKQFRQ